MPPTENELSAGAKRILVIDDERTTLLLMRAILSAGGWQVDTASAPPPARELLARHRYDLVISDWHLNASENGLDLLKESACPGVLMSSVGNLAVTVEAARQGVRELIAKPFDAQTVVRVVQRIFAENARTPAIAYAADALKPQPDAEMLGSTPAMIELFKRIARVAPTTSLVLLTGESGTGKELAARAVHQYSLRAGGPFVPVNCGALTETLLEAELFGHVRGAFTGANADRRGLWEEADGGTLFLDEIGEVSPAMQVKLLRALQEGEIKRVGASRTTRLDTRVIAATNRDLVAATRAGLFREDLFYRLNTVVLHLPALRERRGDIPLLAGKFLAHASARIGRKLALTTDALQILMAYDWPGNVRELASTIEAGALNAWNEYILPEDLPICRDSHQRVTDAPRIDDLYQDLPSLDELERRYLLHLLNAVGGNRTKAAEILRINRRTLYRMAERYGIPLEEENAS